MATTPEPPNQTLADPARFSVAHRRQIGPAGRFDFYAHGIDFNQLIQIGTLVAVIGVQQQVR
jgi:hypothetical protein